MARTSDHRETDHPDAIRALTAIDLGHQAAFQAITHNLARDIGQDEEDVRDMLAGIFVLEAVGMIPAKSKATANHSGGLDPESF